MKIAIVGAGAGGLAALKYGLDDGQECVVFEQTGTIGGSWNYTDDTGLDEHGLPIITTMYKDLRYTLYDCLSNKKFTLNLILKKLVFPYH